MAAKQFPIDLKVLRVILYRYKWMLVTLTFLSFAFSGFLAKSMIKVYSATETLYVDPRNLLQDVAKDIAVPTTLKDQLTAIQQKVLSDDFIETRVIQDLRLRLKDVEIPPMKLVFMPAVMKLGDTAKEIIKKVMGMEIYIVTDEEQQRLDEKKLATTVKQNIDIRPNRNAFITISYKGPNMKACQEIVRILGEQCTELLLKSKNDETTQALGYIQQQYDEKTQKLRQLEIELADTQVAMFDKGPEAKVALNQQLNQAKNELRLIERDLDTLAAKKKDTINAKAQLKGELRSNPDTMQRLGENAQNQAMIQLADLEKQLAEKRKTFTDEWPEVQELKKQIEQKTQEAQSIIQDPEAEEKILLMDQRYYTYYTQVNQLEAEETSLNLKKKEVTENIAIYEDNLRTMPGFEKSFGAIQREISLYTKLQSELALKLETAKSTWKLVRLSGESQVQVINRDFPMNPTGLSPIVMMLFFGLLGPGIGFGIIFLVYYLNTSVKSPEDVRIEYNLPVIAIIPKTNFKKELKKYEKLEKLARTPAKKTFFQRKWKRKWKKSLAPIEPVESLETIEATATMIEPPEPIQTLAVQNIEEQEVELFDKIVQRTVLPTISKTKDLYLVTMLTNPQSQAAEEYRRLCFNIEWGLKESFSGSCKTIMITSALPNEGKTITSINLAISLARNHKVLLIDCNFRHPGIHRAFNIPQDSGLSDLLGNNVIPRLFVPEESPNLSILTAGIMTGHPADLLSSKQMAAFIESVKGSSYFEYVIFDVPPATRIPDASIIASKLDGVVWVVWELGTDKEIVRLALTRVANPSILGVVLNRSEQRILPKRYDKIWKEYQLEAVKDTRKSL